jgi:hypothetical protein
MEGRPAPYQVLQGVQSGASRSIPTSTALSVRSSSQLIRSPAKVRVLGLPQYEPIRSAP